MKKVEMKAIAKPELRYTQRAPESREVSTRLASEMRESQV